MANPIPDPNPDLGDVVESDALNDLVAEAINEKIVVLTQAEYDALDPVNPDVIYVVVG
jgi:hypothetical protein